MGRRTFLIAMLLMVVGGSLWADRTCVDMAAELAPADFSHSGMYSGPGRSQPMLFPRWAAQTTAELREGVRSGRPWSALLNLAADRRQELAQVLRDPQSPTLSFGHRRQSGLIHPIGMSRETSEAERKRAHDEGRMADTPLRRELADLALDLADPKVWPSIFPGSLEVRMGRTRYIGIDGNAIGATDFFVEYGGLDHGRVSVGNPLVKFVDPILKDVFARIDRAKAALDPAVKEAELYAAIYGYYQACPFERGTAAIGQVYWSAVGAEILGRKLILPDGADVRGMIMQQQAFIRWMTEKNSSPAAR